MNEPTDVRGPGRYALDSSDADLQRLLAISDVFAQRVRTAFQRAGLQPGWRAIDCGCGPIGALATLADMVGPTGRVTGVDFSEPTVSRARVVAAALGLDNVEVLAGDIGELTCEELGGPFDLAYARCFFMHQPDPANVLRRIATMLRPGGWIIAHEPLRSPAPRSSPPLDDLQRAWHLVLDIVERLGVPRGSVEGLPRHARETNLEVVETSGFFEVLPPALGFELHAATTAASKDRAAASGVMAAGDVDALVRRLRAAGSGAYAWVTTPFFLALTMRTRSS